MEDTGKVSSGIDAEVTAQVASLAGAARTASRRLALLPRATKDEVAAAMADDLDAATAELIAANARGRRARPRGGAGRVAGRPAAPGRASGSHAVADALRDVAALPDPVGEVVRGSTLANGLQIRQVRVPMGVVGMIYEARPNVTVDAAGLASRAATPWCCAVARPPGRPTGPWSTCCAAP